MPSFLNSLRGGDGQGLVLRNPRSGVVVAERLLPAFDSASRRTGLLKHRSLDPGVAMLIAPTNAVHTFFMRFPIDVAFVTRDGRIVKIAHAVRPWRIAAAWRGYAVVEMAAGEFERSRTVAGDRLVVETVGPR